MGKWATQFYGFVSLDAIHDSTQSYSESAGHAPIARSTTYQGQHGRTIISARNSRLGFKLAAPEFHHIKASAVIEADFSGNQPTGISESQLYTNAAFRVRQFYMKIENPVVDVTVGQTWQLFGWQPFFTPAVVQIPGLPGQIFGRSAQVRLSRTLKTDPINIEIAVAANRPVQRDSEVPDWQGGVRMMVNKWKGAHSIGGTTTGVDPLTIGFSAAGRHLVIPQYIDKPLESHTRKGWGISIDAYVPIIPATPESRANSLSVQGSFATGSAISDLYNGLTNTTTSTWPLPNPNNLPTAPTYTANFAEGLVVFNSNNVPNRVKVQSFLVGAQYYLPPSGKVWLSANYSQFKSDNALDEMNPDNANTAKMFTKLRFADINVFGELTPAVRIGGEYANTVQTFKDGKDETNHRFQLSGYYLF